MSANKLKPNPNNLNIKFVDDYMNNLDTGYNVTHANNNYIKTNTGASVMMQDALNGNVTTAGTSTVNNKDGTEQKTEPMSFEQYILSSKSNADDAYKQAVADAELERQRATLEADRNYSRALSNYGSNAAALSNMGLTGSGYSAYLDSQAYAQRQGDINAANINKQTALTNAQNARDAAYQQADATYASYLEQQKANQLTSFNNFYSNIESYTGNDIDRLASENGLSSEQTQQLKDARSQYTYAQFLGANNYTIKDLDDALAYGNLDKPTYDKLKDNITVLKEEDISAGLFADNSEDGGLIPYKEATNLIKDLKDAGADEKTLEKVEKLLDETYRASSPTKTVTFSKDVIAANPGKAGNNFTVKDAEGNVYYVQYSGDVEDANSNVAHAAQRTAVKTNELFLFNGKVYYKGNDGKYYGVEKRAFAYDYSWNKLMKLFNKDTDKE